MSNKYKRGRIYLINAARSGNLRLVESIVQFVDPNMARRGTTALSGASTYGHLDCVKILLSHGADPNYRDKHGTTALMRASAKGYTDILLELLKAGADPNMVNKYGTTAVNRAVYNGNVDCLKVLLIYGGKPNVGTWPPAMTVAIRQEVYYTSVNLGKIQDIQTCIKMLLDFNVTPNSYDYARIMGHGLTRTLKLCLCYRRRQTIKCAHYGIFEDNIDCVKLLFDADAEDNLSLINAKSLISGAAVHGASHCLRFLLDKGESPHLLDYSKRTLLHLAASGGHSACVQMLLSAWGGENLNLQDKNGRTALMVATLNGHSDCVQLLLSAGIGEGINLQDKNGRTALIIAARGSRTSSVRLLLNAGADDTITDIFNETASSYATEDCAQILSEWNVIPHS